MDSLSEFLKAQRQRVTSKLGSMEKRIVRRRQAMFIPEIEVRKAPGTLSCLTTHSERHQEFNL